VQSVDSGRTRAPADLSGGVDAVAGHNGDVAAFLFDPVRVERLLAVLPALRAAVRSPDVEGKPSWGYPKLRSTRRELYRLLSNAHYRDLRRGLRAIEETHALGCRFDGLLTTHVYEQFQSHMSEVRAAEHFLCRSFTVATIPRAETRTADLHLVGHGIGATVEVFTRREWLPLDEWTDTVRDGLKNVDHHVDFAVSVSTRSVVPRELWSPWDLGEALAKTRVTVLGEIFHDFAAALDASAAYRKAYVHEGVGLETHVEVHVVRAGGDAPARLVSFSLPGFGGYSPAGILRRIVEGPLRDKAGRRQAQRAGAGARCLLVDLSRARIADDLRHPAHRTEAEKVVAAVDPSEFGLDLIAFYRPYSGRLRGRCDYFAAFDDARLSHQDVERLFGPSAPTAAPPLGDAA
jgi:hypothetical protein